LPIPRTPKIKESPEATKKRIMAITTALVRWVKRQDKFPIQSNKPIIFTLFTPWLLRGGFCF